MSAQKQTYIEREAKDQLLSNYKPINDGQYFGSMVILCVTGLVAYGMFLWNRSKSPTAQAEANLKVDLNTELNEFKKTINQDTRRIEKDQAELDKRVSLNERDYTELKVQVNKIDSKLNAQFGSLHNTVVEGNESLMSMLLEKKIIKT